jgi:DNA-binding ferritin-like protein
MSSIAERQEEVVEEFSMFEDWMDKYEYLISLGKELPLIEEDKKVEENIIKGYVPIKNNDAYFQSPTFGQILDYVQHHPKQTSVKEYKGNMIITFRNIKTLDDAYDRLASICKKVMEVVEE